MYSKLKAENIWDLYIDGYIDGIATIPNERNLNFDKTIKPKFSVNFLVVNYSRDHYDHFFWVSTYSYKKKIRF